MAAAHHSVKCEIYDRPRKRQSALQEHGRITWDDKSQVFTDLSGGDEYIPL